MVRVHQLHLLPKQLGVHGAGRYRLAMLLQELVSYLTIAENLIFFARWLFEKHRFKGSSEQFFLSGRADVY